MAKSEQSGVTLPGSLSGLGPWERPVLVQSVQLITAVFPCFQALRTSGPTTRSCQPWGLLTPKPGSSFLLGNQALLWLTPFVETSPDSQMERPLSVQEQETYNMCSYLMASVVGLGSH